MTPDARLAHAAERFADTVAEAIAAQVERAVALERDRHDAALAELRHSLRPMLRLSHIEAIRDELAAMAERQTALTATVAALMAGNSEHSVKAD